MIKYKKKFNLEFTASINKLTPLAEKVYRVVLTIPMGEVRTYKWLAEKIGKPKAARAMGHILKRNPLPLIIPCHRIINSNGKLGGYILGERIKERILDLESKMKACLRVTKVV